MRAISEAGLRFTWLGVCAVAFCVGCAEPVAAPETPDEPEWFPLDTGKSCVTAEVACAPGNCAAKIDNSCQDPVTCSLAIECLCRTVTGEEGPATGRSQDTIPSRSAAGLTAQVICNRGDALQTLAQTVSCR